MLILTVKRLAWKLGANLIQLKANTKNQTKDLGGNVDTVKAISFVCLAQTNVEIKIQFPIPERFLGSIYVRIILKCLIFFYFNMENSYKSIKHDCTKY